MNNTGFKIDNFSRKLTQVYQKMIDLLLEFRHLSLMLDFLRAFPSLNVGFSRDVFAFYARCGASTCPRPPRKSTLRGREGEERRTGSGSMHFSNSKSPEIDRYVRFLSKKWRILTYFFHFTIWILHVLIQDVLLGITEVRWAPPILDILEVVYGHL